MTQIKNTSPYHLSPGSWELGRRDWDLAMQVHLSDADTPEHEGGRDEREQLHAELGQMDAAQLRAYIDGLHDGMSEHFW